MIEWLTFLVKMAKLFIVKDPKMDAKILFGMSNIRNY